MIIFEARPVCALPFDQLEPEASLHGNFDSGTSDLTITHGGVAITEIEKGTWDIHRQIERVTRRDFGSIHVPTEFGGNDATARFSVGSCDTDTAKEGFQRKLRPEI